MYRIVPTKRFNRSFKKLQRSGLLKASVVISFREIVSELASGKPLDRSYADHQLTGDLRAFRECHIKGDLLLIYECREHELTLILIDIGSHSHLFG